MRISYKIFLAFVALAIISLIAESSVSEQATAAGKVLGIIMFSASYLFLIALLFNTGNPEHK